uniref:Uncharacterized protein n=1 Tax=Vespula pensylvanica TaxID=30213 RepID=A0A834JPB2_VESPE|nr:hypothetical protein H0235_017581 [Vespula pensylvanica]
MVTDHSDCGVWGMNTSYQRTSDKTVGQSFGGSRTGNAPDSALRYIFATFIHHTSRKSIADGCTTAVVTLLYERAHLPGIGECKTIVPLYFYFQRNNTLLFKATTIHTPTGPRIQSQPLDLTQISAHPMERYNNEGFKTKVLDNNRKIVFHLNTLYARQSKLPTPRSEEPKGPCEGMSWGKQMY